MPVSRSQLKSFHAVASTGSFTRAAETLFLSQPAVSDQVRKLEDRYVLQLFVRAHRNITLTDLGKELFELIKVMFAVEADAERLLLGKGSLAESKLRLAVDSPRHLSSSIALFRQKHPQISVTLLTSNSEEGLRRLLEGHVDAAVIGRPHKAENTESTILSVAPILVMCGGGHQFSRFGGPGIRISDLDGQALVLRERGSATRRLVEQALDAHNIKTGPVIEASGREAVNDLVASDLGIGFVSAAETHNDSRIVLLPITDTQIIMQENLVWLANSDNENTELFVELVKEQLANIDLRNWIH